ncbi:MAG: serine hydrolase [Chloroflexota bacterium]
MRRVYGLLAVIVGTGLAIAVLLSTTLLTVAPRPVAAAPRAIQPVEAPAPALAPPPAVAFHWNDATSSSDLGVAAESGIAVDIDTGRVLWDKDPVSRRAPASLTKIMTTMVALDHASLDQVLTVPVEAQPRPSWTQLGVTAGERFTVRELVEAEFVVSANDAAETLGRSIEPRTAFIADMNAKVAQLGLHDTHFSNPTGLDAAGQYSTAYDLAALATWLVTHYPQAAELATHRDLHLGASDAHRAYDAYSFNKMLFIYPGATGLKTGQTGRAGGCLVTTAERGGRRVVAVDLHSDVFFTDAVKILDYAFAR